MKRAAKEENLLKLGEEFWPQTPAETMDTGHRSPPIAAVSDAHALSATPTACPTATPIANHPRPVAAQHAHAHAPHGTEDWTRAEKLEKLEIISRLATGLQNATATLTACLTATPGASHPRPRPPAHATPTAHAHTPHGTEGWRMEGMVQTMDTGLQNPPAAAPSAPAHPPGTAESNDREWKQSQVDWCNDPNGIRGGEKLFAYFSSKLLLKLFAFRFKTI